MNEHELQALWQSETSKQPCAFTVGELDESSLRPLAEPAPFQPWVDGRSFLRKLLIARRDAQRFQLLWAVPALPFLLLLYAAERARWLLPVLLGILTVGIVLFVRQVGAVMVTGRAIRRLAPELTVVPGSPIAPPRRFSGWLLVAMALSTVAGVAGYVAVGNKRAVAQQRSRAMAECFDKGADLAFTIAACERLVQAQPNDAEADAALRRMRVQLSCAEKLALATRLESEGLADKALGELEKLSPECSPALIETAALRGRAVGRVIASARRDCLAAVSGQSWGEAMERCGVYSRYACQRADWDPNDAAHLGLLQARERLTPSSAGKWACPDSPVLREWARTQEDSWVDQYPPELRVGVIAFGASQLAEAKEEFSRVSSTQARALLDDVARVEAWEEIVARGYVHGDEPTDCPEFRHALEVEERLVGGMRLAKPTGLRMGIVHSIVAAHFERGQALANREEWRAACAAWQKGIALDRSNVPLIERMMIVCSPRAAKTFATASSCEQLSEVLDFAAEGDGYREKTEERRAAMGCGK